MANLRVEAKPSGGLQNYGIAIDGQAVVMVGDVGIVAVQGVCGDGSIHGVVYGFDGPAGESLGFKIKCSGRIVFAVVGATISNPPHGAGGADFRI